MIPTSSPEPSTDPVAGAPLVWRDATLLAVGDFQPPTRTDAVVLDAARVWQARLVVALWSAPGDLIDVTTRQRWLERLIPGAVLVVVPLPPSADLAPATAATVLARTLHGASIAPTGVVGPGLRDREVARLLGLVYVPIDVPWPAIDPAMVRDDPLRHWDDLPQPLRSLLVRRVAIVGPESTGKTTLARDLAAHYGTAWVSEYLRIWLDAKGTVCEPGDLPPVVAGHRATEEALLPHARALLLLDTDPLMTGVYSRFYYGHLPAWLDRAIAARPADHYLLLDADVPWVPDPQRDMPHRRDEIFALCREELERRGLGYTVISGPWTERWQRAIACVDRLLTRLWE